MRRIAIALWALSSHLFGCTGPSHREGVEPATVPRATDSGRPGTPAKQKGPGTWMLLGGGATPEMNQVSMEEDLLELRQVLGTQVQAALFAGGAGAEGVQILAEPRMQDPVWQELAMFFAPRGGRDARYQPVRKGFDGPADPERFLSDWRTLLQRDAGVPTLYVAAHGDRGERPADNAFFLWGGEDVTAKELAEELDSRQLSDETRLVITSCYSGGFQEVLFRKAERSLGVAEKLRCGLFASTPDRVSSGCDPNPDRARHSGYSASFVRYLSGKTSDGKTIPREKLDLDGDGTVSLLDVHTRVRMDSPSLDVPVTTSDAWLDFLFPDVGENGPLGKNPHEEKLLDGLDETGLAYSLAKARELQKALGEMEEHLHQAEEEELKAFRKAAVDLLARWPVLDDPWHPDFQKTYVENREAIAAHMETSQSYGRYVEAFLARENLMGNWDELMMRSARPLRIQRAWRHLRQLHLLSTAPAEHRETYRAIRRCENSAI